MVGAILFDTINTLLGQPGSYWRHPAMADEMNPFFHFFLARGELAYLLCMLGYTLVAFVIVSIAPRCVAQVIAFSYILAHFFGASTWLCNRWQLGMQGIIIYSIVLSVVLIHVTNPRRGNTSPAPETCA